MRWGKGLSIAREGGDEGGSQIRIEESGEQLIPGRSKVRSCVMMRTGYEDKPDLESSITFVQVEETVHQVQYCREDLDSYRT